MSHQVDVGADKIGSSVASEPAPDGRDPRSHGFRRATSLLHVDRFSGLYVWFVIIIVFSLRLPDTFPTADTARLVLGNQSITAIAALALVIPVAVGVFDLSVAATLGFSLMFVAWLQMHHVNALLAAILAVSAGGVIGLVNGTLVVKLHVDSFIATLGMSSVLAAGAFAITSGQQLVGPYSQDFQRFGLDQPLGLPLPFLILLVLAAGLWYVLDYTPVGRYVYAVGGNIQAARLAGIRTDLYTLVSLVASGLIAAFAGVLLFAQIGTADISSGPPYLLPAFAAVFLGATQIKPGRVNVPGTLVAVYLLATGVTGLQLEGLPSWVETLFNGLALLLAVALAERGKRRASQS